MLVKLTDIPLYARARTYFGTVDMRDYTLSADVKVTETVYNENGTVVHKMPDVGIINQRYVLELKGSKQTLGLHAWPAALPRDETETNLATHKTIPFPWTAGNWYREKLMVRHDGDKAILSGKVWPVGSDEPKDWTIQLEDPHTQYQRCGRPVGILQRPRNLLRQYFHAGERTMNSRQPNLPLIRAQPLRFAA